MFYNIFYVCFYSCCLFCDFALLFIILSAVSPFVLHLSYFCTSLPTTTVNAFRISVPNSTHIGPKKMENKGRNLFTPLSMTVTPPIFTKPTRDHFLYRSPTQNSMIFRQRVYSLILGDRPSCGWVWSTVGVFNS
jgi:hypothetical protein